jgi:hypothetical protein
VLPPHSVWTEIVDGLRAVELVPVNKGRLPVVTHEEYLRMEGFVHDSEPDRPNDVPLLRYVLVNFALMGAGLAVWTGVVAGLVWMLS